MARPRNYDKETVIREAVALFQRSGYDATTVRDILDATGLSSSSLYAAFGGKEQLFLAALKEHTKVERALIHGQLTAPGGLRSNMTAVFDRVIDQLTEPEGPTSLTLRAGVEQAGSMPHVFALLSQYIQELITMFAELLTAAESRGELRLGAPAPDVAHFVLFSAYNLGFVAKVEPSRARLEGYARIALSVLDGPRS